MHIGSPNIHALTLPPGTLPNPPVPFLVVSILPFIIFVLSALYHLMKRDYKGKSELFDKSMMTCLKSLVVYLVVAVIAMSIWSVVFYG